MLRNGVIMDVTTVEQAKIAEQAGAVAVMALEKVPFDIRMEGGIARMADPELIIKIREAISIPVMAKCRIGHFIEAGILQALKVDFIDESEVLTPADDCHHIDKNAFSTPFVCGCRNLGEALRRISEGASLIRTKGEAGTGNILEAVRHLRLIIREIRLIQTLSKEELFEKAREWKSSLHSIQYIAEKGKLPVPLFSAGGVVTPADAALMRKLGAESIFVGSGIFRSANPEKRATAIVRANAAFEEMETLAELSRNLGGEMKGICSSMQK